MICDAIMEACVTYGTYKISQQNIREPMSQETLRLLLVDDRSHFPSACSYMPLMPITHHKHASAASREAPANIFMALNVKTEANVCVTQPPQSQLPQTRFSPSLHPVLNKTLPSCGVALIWLKEEEVRI